MGVRVCVTMMLKFALYWCHLRLGEMAQMPFPYHMALVPSDGSEVLRHD